MRANWGSTVATAVAVLTSVSVFAAAPQAIERPAQANAPAVRLRIPDGESQPGLTVANVSGVPPSHRLVVSCSLIDRPGNGPFVPPVIDQALDIRLFNSKHRPGDRISVGYDIATELAREMAPYVRRGAVLYSTEGTDANLVAFLAADQSPSFGGGVGMLLIPSTPRRYVDRFRGDIQIFWSRPRLDGSGAFDNVGDISVNADVPCS